jgi:hypothetical protein
MKEGRLASIRWVRPEKPLSAKGAKNPIAGKLAATGAPTPPYGMTVRDEVIFFSQPAAEIDHSLLVQYLYAWFSLDTSTLVAGGSADTVRTIAAQEMAHLITEQNLLLSLGEEPYLDHGRLHQESIPFELAPFAEVPLARFITTETPRPSKTPAGRGQLFGQAHDLGMRTSVSPIGNKPTAMPLKPRPATSSTDPEMAGPPLELPDQALPNSMKAQVAQLIELIEPSTKQMEELNGLPHGDPDRPTTSDLTNVLKPFSEDDARLEPALRALLTTLPRMNVFVNLHLQRFHKGVFPPC